MFRKTHPIIGTREIKRAIAFYMQRLGFQLAFQDNADTPNYVGFRRDEVELHMQFQYEHEMSIIRLRFLVDVLSLLNTSNVASSAVPAASATRLGERVSLPSTTWIATHSRSTDSRRAPGSEHSTA